MERTERKAHWRTDVVGEEVIGSPHLNFAAYVAD